MREWILTSCVLILVVTAARFIFRGRVSLRLQYALWGIVMARLLIPVSFGSSPVSAANIPAAVVDQPAVQAVVEAVQPLDYDQAYHQVVEQYEAQGTDVSRLPESGLEQLRQEAQALTEEKSLWTVLAENLVLIWVAGAVAVGGLFLWTNLRFWISLRRTRRPLPVSDARLQVYVSGAVDTPCLFGLIKPAVYLTEAAAADATVLRHSIAHETTHFRHGDHIWSLLRGVCLAVHWYNPLVWWAAFLSQRDGELACDEGTIRRLGEAERAEYGRTLIGMTCRKRTNVLSTATTMTASEGGIKERILLIVRKPKTAVLALVAVLLITAVAVGCTFTGAAGDEADEPGNEIEGTAVFAREEITGITVHYGNQRDIQVEQQDLRKMIAWAQSFTYGAALDEMPEENTGSLTLHYADGTSITAGIDVQERDGIAYRVLRSEFPACWNRLVGITGQPIIPPTLPPDVTQPTWPDTPPREETEVTREPIATGEAVPTGPVTVPVAQIDVPGIGTLYTEADPDRICIMVQPTGVALSGDHRFYIIPEDQEAFLEAYKTATGTLSSVSREGSISVGWQVWYGGTRWFAYQDGTLGTWSGTYTEAENTKALYDLCLQAVRDAGIGEPVQPQELMGIRSATIEMFGTHTIWDWETLRTLESWLVNATYLPGGAGCPFTVPLTLEMNNGERKTVMLAGDSCCAFMSNGVYYQYQNGSNEVLYNLLDPMKLLHGAVQKGGAFVVNLSGRIPLDWDLYGRTYGQQAVMEAMDAVAAWVEEEPDAYTIASMIFTFHGVKGGYRTHLMQLLESIYEMHKQEFAKAMDQYLYDDAYDFAMELLTEQMKKTWEELKQELESLLVVAGSRKNSHHHNR